MNQTKNAKYKFNAQTAPELAQVVTVPEAAMMWKKAAPTITTAWLSGHLEGRKTFSRGNILITVASLTAHYGAPKVNLFDVVNN